MYSDMSMRIIESASSNMNSASVRASSVLPTPVGPKKMNEPIGRFGFFKPARARRMAREMTLIASSWPMMRLCNAWSMLSSLEVSSSLSLLTGIRVQVETMCAISSGPTVLVFSPLALRFSIHSASMVAFLARIFSSRSRICAARSNSCALMAASFSALTLRISVSTSRISGGNEVDCSRTRDAASSIRSTALSGRKRSEM